MKKLTFTILIASLFSMPVFCNPAPPVGIIVEVYFIGDDWFLVADNFCMEMYGIESFEDVSISCNCGFFNFQPDFLPDFSSPRTIISQEALQNTIFIDPVEDEIYVDFPGGYSLAFLEWGPSEEDEVSGPLPGQTLILTLFSFSPNYNYAWFTVKGNSPDCYYSGCSYYGTFEGYVHDAFGNPLANAEIVYLPEYFYSQGYYFPHIYTNANGHFQDDFMLARNYHINKIIVDEIEIPMDEFVVIEPNETTTKDFQIVYTGLNKVVTEEQASISNSPNPFSEVTTFSIAVPEMYCNKNPVLMISDVLGKIVDIVEIQSSQIKNSQATFTWQNEASLPSGNYIVTLNVGKTNLTMHKFTIE